MFIKKGIMVAATILAFVMLSLCGCSVVQDNSSVAVAASKASSTPASTKISEDGQLKVIFLDVGQGNAQLIITPSGKTMLIDGGNNGKEKVMFNYMKQYNVKKIDVVVGSHPDADHIGTLPELIDAMDIGAVYLPKASSNTKTYEALLTSIKKKGLKIKTAKSGVTIELDEKIKVEMVAPVGTYEDNNDMSAVVKVTYGQETFLFPGDAEYNSEQDMIKSGADLSSTVLAVGHHGSNSSSSVGFLKKVNPQYAVVQVGSDNNYGHPTEKTLKKLEDRKIKILRTDKNGTIIFSTDGNTLNVATEK
ncbi:ComEC/Rec2 family competence protein [Paenibacillus taichungensis]